MPPHARVRSVATAAPPHRYAQERLLDLTGYRDSIARQFFRNGDIESRAFSHPVETLVAETPGHDELHRRFVEGATALGEAAALGALARAGLAVADVHLLVVATCTGYVCPSLASRLAGRLGMRRDLQRCDLVGLGCGAALPALQRAADFVLARPGKRALVVATEVCSATYFEDGSAETALANALFADGAAACVVDSADEETPAGGPRILDFETLLDPEHIDYMGFTQVDGRLRILISKHIRSRGPALVEAMLRTLLDRHGLSTRDVRHWVLHSGGRRVIDGIGATLGLPAAAARRSREVLREHGNMSSPTVLFVLERTLAEDAPRAGDLGVLVALGPGFAAEGALLRW